MDSVRGDLSQLFLDLTTDYFYSVKDLKLSISHSVPKYIDMTMQIREGSSLAEISYYFFWCVICFLFPIEIFLIQKELTMCSTTSVTVCSLPGFLQIHILLM